MKKEKSVAKQVEELVFRKPAVLRAIEGGYCNDSALARILSKEIAGCASEESVRAALKRLRIRRVANSEDKVTKLLRKSKISMVTKVNLLAVVHSKQNEARLRGVEVISLAASPNCVTSVLNDESFEKVREHFAETEVLLERRSLVALVITSPATLEDTPNFISFITGRLADDNINILEIYGSYTDDVLVLEQKDALMAFSLLEKMTR